MYHIISCRLENPLQKKKKKPLPSFVVNLTHKNIHQENYRTNKKNHNQNKQLIFQYFNCRTNSNNNLVLFPTPHTQLGN